MIELFFNCPRKGLETQFSGIASYFLICKFKFKEVMKFAPVEAGKSFKDLVSSDIPSTLSSRKPQAKTFGWHQISSIPPPQEK